MIAALADPVVLVAVVAVTFIAAIVGGVGGFGSGIILTVGLVPIIGFKAVVPTLAVAGAIINAGRFWFYRKHVDWRHFRLILLPALPLALAGAWLYSTLDARSIGILLGCVILGFVPLRRWLAARNVQLGTGGVLTGGAMFGAAAGVASGTGVILIATLLGAGLTGQTVLATDAIITIVMDVARATAYGKFAVLDAETAMLGLAIGVASIPGSAVAARIVAGLRVSTHTKAMEALIAVGGASILWQALRTASS